MDFQEFPETAVGSCSPGAGGFSGLTNVPTWYKYLDCSNGAPVLDGIGDVWSIAVAVIEIMLYLGGIAAVFMMAYGGIEFIMSQGQPDRLTRARNILIYSGIGLILTIIARALVQMVFNGFVNGGFSS